MYLIFFRLYYFENQDSLFQCRTFLLFGTNIYSIVRDEHAAISVIHVATVL